MAKNSYCATEAIIALEILENTELDLIYYHKVRGYVKASEMDFATDMARNCSNRTSYDPTSISNLGKKWACAYLDSNIAIECLKVNSTIESPAPLYRQIFQSKLKYKLILICLI